MESTLHATEHAASTLAAAVRKLELQRGSSLRQGIGGSTTARVSQLASSGNRISPQKASDWGPYSISNAVQDPVFRRVADRPSLAGGGSSATSPESRQHHAVATPATNTRPTGDMLRPSQLSMTTRLSAPGASDLRGFRVRQKRGPLRGSATAAAAAAARVSSGLARATSVLELAAAEGGRTVSSSPGGLSPATHALLSAGRPSLSPRGSALIGGGGAGGGGGGGGGGGRGDSRRSLQEGSLRVGRTHASSPSSPSLPPSPVAQASPRPARRSLGSPVPPPRTPPRTRSLGASTGAAAAAGGGPRSPARSRVFKTSGLDTWRFEEPPQERFSAGIVERSLAATAQLRRKTASDSLSEKWRHQDSMMIDGSTAALSKIRAMASLRRGLDLVPRGRHNDARLDHLNESDQICVSSPAAAAEEEQHSWRDTQAQLSVETLYARLEAADIPIPAGVSRQAMAFAVKGIPHQGRSSHEIVSFDEVFADLDKDGSLNRQQFACACAFMGNLLGEEEAAALFDDIDEDGDGCVSMREFREWWDTDVVPDLEVNSQRQ